MLLAGRRIEGAHEAGETVHVVAFHVVGETRQQLSPDERVDEVRGTDLHGRRARDDELDDVPRAGDATDALEFIIAGASAVQIGTANFVDPFIWPKLLDGLSAYMERHGVERVSELVGTIDLTSREKQWISS